MKKVLQEQYGWPYDFREAEWRIVSKVTWQRIKRDDPTYETDRDDELEPDVLKGDKDHYDFYLWHWLQVNLDLGWLVWLTEYRGAFWIIVSQNFKLNFIQIFAKSMHNMTHDESTNLIPSSIAIQS